MRAPIIVFATLPIWLAPDVSIAGQVADLFREGVFGVLWDASPTQVETAMPGGKWSKIGEVKFYTVADARTVFGIERTKKQHIIFSFSTSEKMNGVSVEFPAPLMSVDNFATLLAKSTEAFGPPVSGADAPKAFEYSAGDVGGIASHQVLWPSDEDITVNIVSTTTQTLLAVKNVLTLNIGRNKVEAKSKEDLGLN